MKKPLVLLIDSNAVIHRAYHAYPKNLSTKDGKLVNAAYGFFSILLQVIRKFNPTEIYFAFDSKEKTFRHKLDPNYKATRKKTDEELIVQFKTIKDVLEQADFNFIELPGYEADDIIGTLAESEQLQGKEKIIVTGDGDLMQLINGEVKVFLSGNGFQKSSLYDSKTAADKLGYDVTKIIEYKGLRGDSSDNIPGVKGIGELTAKKLLTGYDNLEQIYKNLDKLDSATKKKLEQDREGAFQSRYLATIDTKVPMDLSRGKSLLSELDYDGLQKALLSLEFKSLLPKISALKNQNSASMSSGETSQLDMADVGKLPDADDGFAHISEQDYRTVVANSGYVVIKAVLAAENNYSKLKVLFGNSYGFICNCNKKDYAVLLNMLDRKSMKLVTFNSKELHQAHLLNNFEPLPVDFDIRLAAYLLSANSVKLDLENLALEYLDTVWTDASDMDELKLLGKLYLKLEKLMANETAGDWNLTRLLNEIELPLSLVLAKMELAGVKMDTDYLLEFAQKLDGLITKIEKKIYEQAGVEFNLASPKQLGEVLFGKMKLPGAKKGRGGSYSTNEKVLNNLVNDFSIVRDILEYREIAKLKSTYTTTLINQVNPKTGRIHSKFRQDITATGRLSSIDPNLQNIPISSDLGQEVRRAFVPEKGNIFLFLDYSQQELRILAHLSGEENLIKAFEENIDIHALTASRILKKPIEQITKNERRMGKTVNFGIVYGISAFGLADRLKIDNATGQKYIDSFFTAYPKVAVYFDNLLKQGKMDGYITTIAGRKKKTDGLNSPVFQVRKASERELINFPLQGSAADMIKLAMVKAQKIIDENYADYAKMVLQIHDELVFEISGSEKDKRFKTLAKELSAAMLEVFELKVNMKVDVEVGKNLADGHKLLLK